MLTGNNQCPAALAGSRCSDSGDSGKRWELSRKNRSHLHFHVPFTYASSLLSSYVRAWNRLHSSKIHKTLIMQKCPNLQQELKYQEFLYPVGKKANTSLRVSLFLNSFKPPTTLHLYAWTHICARPFSMLFPHGKKNLFVIPCRVRNCAFLVANVTKNLVLATRISYLVAS